MATQYDKECFSIGTFIPVSETSLEEMLSFFEMILGSSPQYLKSFKHISVLNEQIPVLFKQALRAISSTTSGQEDPFSLNITSSSNW